MAVYALHKEGGDQGSWSDDLIDYYLESYVDGCTCFT